MSHDSEPDPYGLRPLLERALDGDEEALNDFLAKIRAFLKLAAKIHPDMGQMRRRLSESDIVQDCLVRIVRAFAPASPQRQKKQNQADAVPASETPAQAPRKSADAEQVTEARFRGTTVPQFLAWASKILGRIIHDAVDKQKAGKRDLEREAYGSKIPDLWATTGAPADSASRAQAAVAISEALERLPARYSEVIRSRYFEGKSFEDISHDIDLSPGALRVIHYRAIRKLKSDPLLANETDIQP